LRGTIFGILAASIWGGMYVVSDVVLHTIPPFTLLSLRLLIGVLILGVILAQRGQIKIARHDLIRLLGVGMVGFGVSLGAQFVGTHLATAINGAVITSASAAFIVLFAFLVLREPLTPIRIGAVLLASVGVLAILDLSHFDLSSNTSFGNIALIIAALTWALYSVLVRLVSKDYPTLTISFYAFIGGLIIALPASVLELGSQPIGEITVGVVLGVLYLGVISTALAMLLWNEAFALVEASRAALFFFAQPLVGVILATLLLHQPITIQLIVGGTLVILGVLVSIRGDNVASVPVSAAPDLTT
jgi:drug/metabolite transporter (DMT)-like permease